MYDDDIDPTERRLWKWTVIGLVAALVVVAGCIVVGMFHHDLDPLEEVQRMPTVHPVFGSIHMATASDVSELPQVRSTNGNLLPRYPICLILGANTMEWSSADVRPGRLSGYLYLWDTTSRGTNVWEVAPCSKHTLAEVAAIDLNATFFSAQQYDKGKIVFGTNWTRPGPTTHAIYIKEGSLILVRHSQDPSTIYVLEMTRQKRGNLWARYLEVHK